MYNGIGLATVRGSATSGHVQKNMSYIKPEFFRNKVDANQSGGRYSGGLQRKDGTYKVNKDVIEHNKKHALEAKVYEFEDSLREGGGLSEEAIEEQVAAYRKKLAEQSARGRNDFRAQSRTTDTHEISARKTEENERIRAAFGIRDDFAAGSSFDPVAQEQRRKEREAERAARFEQNKLDRQRRDQEREQREQSRSLRREDDEGGRLAREKYVPKDRSGDARRGRSRSGSADRGDRRRVDSRDRKRRRSASPSRRGRSPESRERRGGRDRRRDRDSRSRERQRGDRARSPSGEGERKIRSGIRSRSRSSSPPRPDDGRGEPSIRETAVDREGSRGRSRSRSSSSSGSSRSSSSGSSRSSRSSRSRSSSGARRVSGERSNSHHSPSPRNSPPRRKTRWGDK